MKNFPKIILFVIVSTILVIFACTKEPAPSEIIASTSWKLTKTESKISTGTFWGEKAVESCEADDVYNFSANGTYTTDEGPTKCDPLDDQSTSGTWVLTTDGKTLTITAGGFGASYTLEELTNAKMIYIFTETLGGVQAQHRSTFEPI